MSPPPRDFNIFSIHIRPSPLLSSLFPLSPAPASTPARALRSDPSRVTFDASDSPLSVEVVYTLQHDGKAHKSAYPLQFQDKTEEIGFYFLMNALRLGSRFDRYLHEQSRNKRDAYDTVEYGILGMFIGGKKPQHADGLVDASTPFGIASHFDFPIHESKNLPFAQMGGVTQDVDGPLLPFAQAVSRCMNEMGTLLRARRLENLGQLALHVYEKENGKKSPQVFAETMARILPVTFGDANNDFAFLCKARRTVHELATRFPETFIFEETSEPIALADANLVFALRILGVLKVSKDFADRLDSEHPNTISFGGRDEFALRMAAVEAVHALTKGQVPDDDASEWLVEKSKLLLHTKLRRHLCETTAY